MIKRLTSFFVKLVQNFLPDPFLFAIILSGILFVLGITVNKETPFQMIIHWGNGFWGFLAFSMQMVLVIVLGNTVANAPVFQRILKKLAQIPKTPKQAVAFVTIVAGISCMIQWGFGLVIGAIFAKEVAKTVKKVDYRLLIASAYSAFLLTVLTSSITLKAASNIDELTKVSGGVLTSLIPLMQTAYHPATLGALIVLLITLPLLNSSMHPSEEETVSIDPNLLVTEGMSTNVIDKKTLTPASRIENSRLVSILIFIAGVIYVYNHFFIKKASLNIDIMNFMLFIFGILLHGNPISFVKAVGEATRNSSGIILQFPFYAGIMGMMTGNNAEGVSLAGIMSSGIVSLATTTTYPFFTFISAALVNMFVPSAGGQWAVQAPVMFPAAKALGADYAITTMAITWGDTWTNMIQPFWALPALGIAGLKVRDIMGFCVMIFLWSGIVITCSLLAWVVFFL
jgi:short-chain fatty acids transporter